MSLRDTFASVFVVAIVALASSIEDEAPLLAIDLGKTTYETALLLRAGMPLVALRTEDANAARALVGRLRARGHTTVACSLDAVLSSEAMPLVRHFRFEPDAFVRLDPLGHDPLPFHELFAIVRATHTTREDSVVTTKERHLSVGRGALSGGILVTKTRTKDTTRSDEAREPVAYLFRSTGAPWLMRATCMRYDGLGAVAPGQLENFDALLRALRERAPFALYDERLLAIRHPPAVVRSSGKGQSVSSTASGVDLLAHLVALSLARR